MRKLSSIVFLVALCSNLMAQSPHGKDFSMDCSDCHTTEGWKVNLKNINFNHDKTKFKLEGQHREINCKSCHQSLVFTGTGTDCISCHTDMHYQTVGPDCARCHTPKSWIVENITAIHQVSRFPLVGPHVTADCYACHPSESLLRFEPLGVSCYDCHKDKYLATTSPNHVESNYSTNCEECHLMTSFDWTGASVNHSFFPLTGGHSIDCIKCHTTGVFGKIPAECVSCHQANYNSTTDPNHTALNFSTDCSQCHSLNPGWKPASYKEHDAQFFPIYSGSHNGKWTSCTDCHPNPANYAEFTCIDCHTHNKTDTDNHHGEVSGYSYNSQACYECHPSGGGGGFNHATSNFPLTGAHQSIECTACHSTQFAGTPTICYACHETNYNQSTNPNHLTAGIATTCETCHSTAPGWKPALFPQHSTIYPLTGAHAAIPNCEDCHTGGNYVTTPNLCYGCHATIYNQSMNPNHAAAQFPNTCEICHNTTAWTPSTFNHDGLYFPIYSGTHAGTWTLCSQCHTNPSNFAVFTCTTSCHPQGQMDPAHSGVSGYTYNIEACFTCHPTGGGGGKLMRQKSIPKLKQ
jgi:hypothetical protein